MDKRKLLELAGIEIVEEAFANSWLVLRYRGSTPVLDDQTKGYRKKELAEEYAQTMNKELEREQASAGHKFKIVPFLMVS